MAHGLRSYGEHFVVLIFPCKETVLRESLGHNASTLILNTLKTEIHTCDMDVMQTVNKVASCSIINSAFTRYV